MLLKIKYSLLSLVVVLGLGVMSAAWADPNAEAYVVNNSDHAITLKLVWGANEGIGPYHHKASPTATIQSGQTYVMHSNSSGIGGSLWNVEVCVAPSPGSTNWSRTGTYNTGEPGAQFIIYSNGATKCSEYNSSPLDECQKNSDSNHC